MLVSAPYFRRFSKNPSLKAFVDGMTAAATGAIAGMLVAGAAGLLLKTGAP
jgi:chromate transporter